VITVAALYVDPRGPYPGIPGVECWDETRDARNYAGPHPVVAHPPCGPWGALKHMRVPNRERRTQDADCAGFAVAAVRRWGGVLEQPARSLMFREFGMPSPFGGQDQHGGWTLHCCQVEWGHPARKQSWIYVVGTERFLAMPPFPGRRPTHWVSGGRIIDRKGSGGIVPPGIKVCSAQQRRRTPPAFAEFLVELARKCRNTEAA
jgi:hypothetical protein